MSYKRLRGRIVEKYGTATSFAGALGRSKQYVYNKLSNRTDFTKADMDEWSKLLEIKTRDIGDYFFTQDVT